MWQSRTTLVIGEENIAKLTNAHILVVGLGGVGAYAAEMLCRAGIGEFTIVDGDKINETNINRQLLALKTTEGQSKALLLERRLKDINPSVIVHTYDEYIKDQRMIDILKQAAYDFVIDAIDTLSPKTYLIYHSRNLGLKVVSSMGSGGKFDPSQIQVVDISQTYNCQLADALRKKLHKLDIYTDIYAVFSPEKAAKHTFIEAVDEPNKKTTLGTISYMPAIFGCLCASVVIRELIGEPFNLKLTPKVIKKTHKNN